MSSRIMICPGCGAIAALVELPDDTMLDLVGAAAQRDALVVGWSCKAYWCPSCDMPIIEAWPAKVPVGRRRELVGLPADLLQVDKEGGGA